MIIEHDNRHYIDVNHILKISDLNLLALHELAYAFIILCRLGIPKKKRKIKLLLSGYLAPDVIDIISNFLSYSITARSIIKYNCLLEKIPININTNNKSTYKRSTLNKDKCLLLFSSGLDSLVAEYVLSKKYALDLLHIRITKDFHEIENRNNVIYIEDLLSYDNVDFLTQIDTFDNDPWENYGLYFLYTVYALRYALENDYGSLSIGLNKDDLFGYDIISGKKFYSQCCQSYLFTEVIQTILDLFNVDLILPLKQMTGIDRARVIINKGLDLEHSTSCIVNKDFECGECFSCYDKLTSLLSVSNPDMVNVRKTDSIIITNNDNLLMRISCNNKIRNNLEQLRTDHISSILLNRIILGEDIEIVRASKFSLRNLLVIFKRYPMNHPVIKQFFPSSCRIFCNNENNFSGLLNSLQEKRRK